MQPTDRCPDLCPLWAQDTLSGHGCIFKCVRSTECGLAGAHVSLSQSVPDVPKGTCRSCNVTGCSLCSFGKDLCLTCDKGFTLHRGKCISTSASTWLMIMACTALLVVYILVWYMDLMCRKNENPEGVTTGLEYRSWTKLRMPLQTGGGDSDAPSRPLYPLSTNLLTSPAAGPGNALFFRFQLALIIWSVLLTVLWTIIAGCCDWNLLMLGWATYKTPFQLCSIMDWGHVVQERTANVKVAFLAAAYAISFLGCVVFGVLQLRCFQHLDDETTMKDFVAYLEGLPRDLPGSEPLEELLAQAVREATHQEVVGVSVCWNYDGKDEEIMEALEDELEAHGGSQGSSSTGPKEGAAAQAQQATPPAQAASAPTVAGESGEAAAVALLEGPPPARRGLRERLFGRLERVVLEKVLEVRLKEEGHTPPDAASLSALAKSCSSGGAAFVVFNSEDARDAALAAVAGGLQFRGAPLTLRSIEVEPSEVRWSDYRIDRADIFKRTILWSFVVLIGFAAFAFCVYLPYALYVTSFNYDSGNEPPAEAYALLTAVVVACNLATFLLSEFCSQKIGYVFESDRMSTYMILYCGAVFLQVACDMVLTARVSYVKMVAEGAHSFDGKAISNIASVQAIFETFPMQQTLGNNLFWYVFPACFLLPFLGEPIAVIAAPFHISKLLVQCYPQVKGRQAEKALKIFNPMDTSRYADVLVNLFLAVLVFWLPGGFTIPVIGGMAVSHIYIYGMDHYKVLRCVPSFTSASSATDRQAQRMLAVPCGLILSCVIFKQNCSNSAGSFCLDGGWIFILCVDVFVLHVLLHLAILAWVVPQFGLKDHKRSSLDYAQASSKIAASWFSTNPMHCLRSKYFYNHSPPCSFLFQGKEHLMVKNPTLGCHFEEQYHKPEEFL